jgi:hypothetical protein
MKATLTFSLPEESEAHAEALRGSDYRALLDDLCKALREVYKYDGPGNFGGHQLADLFKSSDGAAKLREAIFTEAAARDLPLS